MYAHVENGSVSSYPYTMRALKAANPNVSFPVDSFSRDDVRGAYDIVTVASTDRPDSKGYKVTEGPLELISGTWTQTWVKTLKQPHEVDSSEITNTIRPVESGKVSEMVLPVWDGTQWNMTWELKVATWLEARVQEYGSVDKQLEFITENGLEAWQNKVSSIKAAYPKTS